MSKGKIGFWAVVSLVTGSQIGSSVFMLPANAAPFGLWSLAGLLLASIGALALALVFAALCGRFPQTGGPHVYVHKVFGKTAAFFTGWTYWLISWVSTTAVVVTCIGYLTPIIGQQTVSTYLFLQILLLGAITWLNLNGVRAAGVMEIFLTILKFVPLLILPIAVLPAFSIDNFVVSEAVQNLPHSSRLSQTVMLTMWGFIGLELATTPANSVENPHKTIPRAIALGTFLVAIFYLFNCMAIMGAISGQQLATSAAPYADVAKHVFGGNWHLGISLAAAIVCVGTLNAWVLSSGQVALGLAEDGLLPKWVGYQNKSSAPSVAILLSTVGIVPCLFLTATNDFAAQMWQIVDISVTAFLFVYLICTLAYAVLLYKERHTGVRAWLIVTTAALFCIWVIGKTPLSTLAIAGAFTLSGLPIYYIWYKKNAYRTKTS